MPETYIYGIKVVYDDIARGAVDYLLHNLDAEEARVFFNQARQTGMAKFENNQGVNYTLSCNSGAYSLKRR